MDAHAQQDLIEPAHYRAGGLEVIEIIEAFDLDFCRGNALKYLLRAGRKPGSDARVDLAKCVWYVERARAQLATAAATASTPTEGAGREPAFVL